MSILTLTSISCSCTKRHVYRHIFIELINTEKHGCSITTEQNTAWLFFLINAIFILHVVIINYWLFKYLDVFLKEMKILIAHKDLLFLYYNFIIFYLSVELLTNCKQKYQDLNQMISSIKYSEIYDESFLSDDIKKIEYILQRLSVVVKMLNIVLGSQLLLMPIICSGILLQLCLSIKHVWVVPQGFGYSYSIAKLMMGISFMVSFISIILFVLYHISLLL